MDGRTAGSTPSVFPVGYSADYSYFLGTAYTFLGNSGNWDWLYLNGSLDEVRVSNNVRSADWIRTEFNNQSSPSTFYSFYPTTSGQVAPASVSLYAGQSQQFTSTGSCDALAAPFDPG